MIFALPAQAEIKPGVRTGGYFDSDAFFIGGEILTPIATDWYFNPNVEFAFGDEPTLSTNELRFPLPTLIRFKSFCVGWWRTRHHSHKS